MSRQGKGKGKQTALSMTRKCQTSRAYKAAFHAAKAAGKGSEAAKEQGRIASDLFRKKMGVAEAYRLLTVGRRKASGRPMGPAANWWARILAGGRRFYLVALCRISTHPHLCPHLL